MFVFHINCGKYALVLSNNKKEYYSSHKLVKIPNQSLSSAEYFIHLQMHLQKMNELCERLSLQNESKCDISLVNIRCPGCEELVLLSHKDTKNQISHIIKHIKYCSWLIVSERQRLNSKSKVKRMEKSSIKSAKTASKLIWSLNENFKPNENTSISTKISFPSVVVIPIVQVEQNVTWAE